jgi:LPS-assembly lipoprotein
MTPSGPAFASDDARRSVGLAANLTLRIAPRANASKKQIAATGTSPASALRARRGGGMIRTVAIAALCVALAGCGFTPLYGGGKLAPQLSSIYVEEIPERNGFELRTRLIEALNTDGVIAGKRYRLKVSLSESSQGIALQNDATITRYNNRMEAKYVLTDAGGTVVTQGVQSELSSYNVVQSPYATLAAEQDAGKRAAQDMAERIRLELGVWFRKNR